MLPCKKASVDWNKGPQRPCGHVPEAHAPHTCKRSSETAPANNSQPRTTLNRPTAAAGARARPHLKVRGEQRVAVRGAHALRHLRAEHVVHRAAALLVVVQPRQRGRHAGRRVRRVQRGHLRAPTAV